MASPITFGGLASGLDTNAIVSALVAVEQRQVTLLQTQKSTAQSKSDLFTKLKGLLDTLKTKSDALSSQSSVVAFSAKPGTDGFFTASADGTASAANYEVEVTALAQSGRKVTVGYADQNATSLGTGTLKVTVGTTTTNIAIDAAHATLGGIRDAINAANIGAKASIINDGSGSPYRLSIEGKDTGAANTLSIDASGLTGGGATISFDNALNRTAQDAVVKIDGVTIKRGTNTIQNAIKGVTLTLSDETTSAVKLAVSVNDTQTHRNIQDFVDAYNAVVGFANDQAKYDTTAKKSGPLSGDTTLRSLGRQLGSIISGRIEDTTQAVQSLRDAGVQLDNSGKLSIDSTKLDKALDDHLASVVNLFSNASQGIAKRMSTAVDRYTDSLDGLLKARQDGFSTTIKSLSDQIDRAQAHVDDFQQQMIIKFASLEQSMARLNQQGASLSALNK